MELKFTGNWFIDVGILGFVNLMEKIYGEVWKEEWKEKNPNEPEWKFDFLEYLNEKIEENEELVYYGYFPLGYFVKWLRDRGYEIDEAIINDFLISINKIKKLKKEKIFEKIWWKYILKLFKNLYIEKKLESLKSWISKNENKEKWKRDKYNELKIGNKKITEKELELLKKFIEEKEVTVNEIKFKQIMNEELNQIIKKENLDQDLSLFFRIPIDSSFYKNFLFFNNSKGNLEQKDSFLDLLNLSSREESLKKIDKVINKLLPSQDEFHNVFYCLTSIENLKENIPYLFVYLICFTYAFERFRNIGSVLFYSNDLKLTYFVNKRLELSKKRIEKNNKDFNKIFKVTWDEIINTLIQYKSEWSLENMYIIRYRRLDNQTQEDIEYIGIPKLQAQVLLDDHIRNALNQRATILKAGKNTISKWILEEFISGKPLYPLALQHIRTSLTDDKTKTDYFIFYALLLDAAISEFKEKQKKSLFSDNFLSQNYKEIAQQVKREFSISYHYVTSDLQKYFENRDERERVAYLLLDSLYGNDKARFLGILLKQLNNTKKNINLPALDWVFNKIINNNTSWKEYALLLTGGLVYND